MFGATRQSGHSCLVFNFLEIGHSCLVFDFLEIFLVSLVCFRHLCSWSITKFRLHVKQWWALNLQLHVVVLQVSVVTINQDYRKTLQKFLVLVRAILSLTLQLMLTAAHFNWENEASRYRENIYGEKGLLILSGKPVLKNRWFFSGTRAEKVPVFFWYTVVIFPTNHY